MTCRGGGISILKDIPCLQVRQGSEGLANAPTCGTTGKKCEHFCRGTLKEIKTGAEIDRWWSEIENALEQATRLGGERKCGVPDNRTREFNAENQWVEFRFVNRVWENAPSLTDGSAPVHLRRLMPKRPRASNRNSRPISQGAVFQGEGAVWKGMVQNPVS